jgi:hypothetical protein
MQAIFRVRKTSCKAAGQQGYILLTLMLFCTLLIVAGATAAGSMASVLRREREMELIHRGVQYTRAIREFTRKTGRYPLRIEELDSTNGRRYLRKHYKDPITGKDFKLLHFEDVQTANNLPGIGLASANAGAGKSASNATAAVTGNSSEDGSSSLSSATNAAGSGAAGDSPSTSPSSASPTTPVSATSGQPLSGGLIIGVVSSSKKQSIREFHRKRHYNEWKFYYDTALDQSFLTNAPTEKPSFQSVLNQPQLNPAIPAQPAPQLSQAPSQ